MREAGDMLDPIRAPRDGGPQPRPGEPLSQYGAVQALLSWQVLAGAVRLPFAQLAARLDLRVERSFNERYDCAFAYLETDRDAFTLVSWLPSADVEVWAVLNGKARPSSVDLPAGAAEFRRFLELAAVASEDVVIPRGLRRRESPW